MCNGSELFLGVRHSEQFEDEVPGGDMGVDRDSAPDDFIFANFQLRKRDSQQGPIGRIYLHIKQIDLPTGDVEYLDLTQGGF
jgi:hypothetical protein